MGTAVNVSLCMLILTKKNDSIKTCGLCFIEPLMAVDLEPSTGSRENVCQSGTRFRMESLPLTSLIMMLNNIKFSAASLIPGDLDERRRIFKQHGRKWILYEYLQSSYQVLFHRTIMSTLRIRRGKCVRYGSGH